MSLAADVFQPAGFAATVDVPCPVEYQGAGVAEHLLSLCFCSEVDAAVIKLGFVIDVLQICTVQESML
jgi:hypothetical protein